MNNNGRLTPFRPDTGFKSTQITSLNITYKLKIIWKNGGYPAFPQTFL